MAACNHHCKAQSDDDFSNAMNHENALISFGASRLRSLLSPYDFGLLVRNSCLRRLQQVSRIGGDVVSIEYGATGNQQFGAGPDHVRNGFERNTPVNLDTKIQPPLAA